MKKAEEIECRIDTLSLPAGCLVLSKIQIILQEKVFMQQLFWDFVLICSPFVVLFLLLLIKHKTKKISDAAFVVTFGLYMTVLIWITPLDAEILNHVNANKFWIVEGKILKFVFPAYLFFIIIYQFVTIVKKIRKGCV